MHLFALYFLALQDWSRCDLMSVFLQKPFNWFTRKTYYSNRCLLLNDLRMFLGCSFLICLYITCQTQLTLKYILEPTTWPWNVGGGTQKLLDVTWAAVAAEHHLWRNRRKIVYPVSLKSQLSALTRWHDYFYNVNMLLHFFFFFFQILG